MSDAGPSMSFDEAKEDEVAPVADNNMSFDEAEEDEAVKTTKLTLWPRPPSR